MQQLQEVQEALSSMSLNGSIWSMISSLEVQAMISSTKFGLNTTGIQYAIHSQAYLMPYTNCKISHQQDSAKVHRPPG